MLNRAVAAGWLIFALVAAGGWYITATRLSYRWGLEDAAPAVGVIVGVAAGLLLWRWSRSDSRAASLERLACPDCGARLDVAHEHARPGALSDGLTEWRCSSCGFAEARPLTCPQCAA
jgi:uncharacterized protein YbaR (Trm112 family)